MIRIHYIHFFFLLISKLWWTEKSVDFNILVSEMLSFCRHYLLSFYGMKYWYWASLLFHNHLWFRWIKFFIHPAKSVGVTRRLKYLIFCSCSATFMSCWMREVKRRFSVPVPPVPSPLCHFRTLIPKKQLLHHKKRGNPISADIHAVPWLINKRKFNFISNWEYQDIHSLFVIFPF